MKMDVEREAFEAWAYSCGISATKTAHALMFYNGRRVTEGGYIIESTALAWASWQARASLPFSDYDALRAENDRLSMLVEAGPKLSIDAACLELSALESENAQLRAENERIEKQRKELAGSLLNQTHEVQQLRAELAAHRAE